MIYGIGTDIAEVARINEKLAKDNGFKEKAFTVAEIAYCESKKQPAVHFAARFAAKEAFAKALGTGWIGQCEITDVEVVNDAFGKPQFALCPVAAAIINAAGIGRIHLSISHTAETAVAMVVLETTDIRGSM
ncbi:holo-ACP synthase [soil metagenome]